MFVARARAAAASAAGQQEKGVDPPGGVKETRKESWFTVCSRTYVQSHMDPWEFLGTLSCLRPGSWSPRSKLL